MMQNRTSAADRLRPFIQAMERSIDQARSRRMVDGRTPSVPSSGHLTPGPEQSAAQPVEPIRMKARPKRDFIRP